MNEITTTLNDFLVSTKSTAALILNGKGKLITSLNLDYGDSIAAMSAAILIGILASIFPIQRALKTKIVDGFRFVG